MKKITSLFTLLFITLSMQAQIAQVSDALSKNDAEALSVYFANNVELEMDEKEGMYGKSQATIMVRDFFAKIKPATFTQKHKSEAANSKFIIGNLNSKGQTWRVTVYFRKEGSTDLIHSFKIEKE